MSAVAEALAKLPANHLVVNGEVIVPDDAGRGNFSALETALGIDLQSHRMLFYVFDLMHLDGFACAHPACVYCLMHAGPARMMPV